MHLPILNRPLLYTSYQLINWLSYIGVTKPGDNYILLINFEACSKSINRSIYVFLPPLEERFSIPHRNQSALRRTFIFRAARRMEHQVFLSATVPTPSNVLKGGGMERIDRLLLIPAREKGAPFRIFGSVRPNNKEREVLRIAKEVDAARSFVGVGGIGCVGGE